VINNIFFAAFLFLYILTYTIVLNTKELVLVFIFVIIFLCTLPTNYIIHGEAPVNDIKITSPNKGEVVPVGNLTINGTSSDNANSDCQVYVDWNNLKPFQNASPTGAAGANDYSNWTFTYNDDYHLITKGSNELTANLFCLDNPSAAAYSSINIIGQTPTTDTARTASSDNSGGDSKQYSGDDSGRDSREEPFTTAIICVIFEDYSNGDDGSKDGNNGEDCPEDGNNGEDGSKDGNNGDDGSKDGNNGDDGSKDGNNGDDGSKD
jgi:hypothetical protein